MMIKGLKIGRFGKLKDLKIHFHGGLNVIYGENEAGKTTLQSFIKAMFYGMNSSKKNLRENERKRFLPWTGEDAEGELYFQDDDQREYFIKRRFGGKRKKDDAIVLDLISGEEASHIDASQPGLSFFGIGEEAFEKTIFIKQLHCRVERDKEDEIMKRLTNLQQTGDEDTSYYKAMGALQQVKKDLTGQRKTGKLDALKKYYDSLKEELSKVNHLHEENIEDQIKLNKLLEERRTTKAEIAVLEKRRKQIRQLQRKEEYLALCSYIDRINALSEEIEGKNKQLAQGDTIADEGLILDLKGKARQWKELRQQLSELYGMFETEKVRYEEKKDVLQSFEGYEDLEEDAEVRLAAIRQECRQIEEKLQEWHQQKQELAQLEAHWRDEQNSLGALRKFEEVLPSMEMEVYDKEEQLKELRHKIHGETRRENFQLKRDLLRNQMRTASGIMIAALLVTVGGLIGAFVFHAYFYALSGFGLLLCSYGWIHRRKIAEELRNVEREIAVIGDGNLIMKEIEAIQKDLNEIYSRLGVAGFQEFRAGMMKYGEKRNRIEELKVRMEDRRKNINEEQIRNLERTLEQWEGYVRNIYRQCRCSSLEEFRNNLRKYRSMLSEKEAAERELEDLEIRIKQMQDQIVELEKDLGHRLDLQDIDEEKVENCIEGLSEILKDKNELDKQRASLEEACKVMLKGRTLEEIGKEMEEMGVIEDMDSAGEPEKEEILEEALKEKQERWVALEKQIKDIENLIQNRFAHSRGAAEIEGEMRVLEERMAYYEEMAAAIDCTMEVLENSFREIQRNFGPRLNRKVGTILGRITNGKYEDLKISENYGVKIIDPVEDKVKDMDYFSNGTWDQIYFAMRMGIADLIFDQRAAVPMIMDDAFVQYDDRRLEAVLHYLYEYGKNRQVILLTCQKRELDLLEKFEKVHYIYL